MMSGAAIEILLVEDNPADVKLTTLALQKTRLANVMQVVQDGEEAMAYLRQEGKYESAVRPDLILLDLNLPKKSGHEVLVEVKTDPNLKSIPVVILTSSDDEKDIVKTYNDYANCYITKPVELEGFMQIVKSIEDFWFAIVKLPRAKAMS
jgi:two-component system, chemotaxis family, response regulator Rcp1